MTQFLNQKFGGGTKLQQVLKKNIDGNIGESWEISGIEGDISQILNGPFKKKSLTWLLENYKEKLVGEKVYKNFGNQFPLLFKFIDARENLSVQVHPDDSLAKTRHNSFGKTELWYIIDAEKNGKLILGFNERMDQKKYLKTLSENRIVAALNYESIKNGDAFIIIPGTVHAIGAGVLLAEIQQTSDITYRIFDWDRPDANGQERQLHTDLALDAIDFNQQKPRLEYLEEKNIPAHIGTTDFFSVNKLVDGNSNFSFSEKVESPEIYYLYVRLKDGSLRDDRITFFAENGTMNIQTNLSNFGNAAVVKGSKNDSILREYDKLKQRYVAKNLEFIEQRFKIGKKNSDSLEMDLSQKQKALILSKYLATINFALNNKEYEVAPYLILSEAYNSNIKYLDTVYNALAPKIKDSKYGKELESFIVNRKKTDTVL